MIYDEFTSFEDKAGNMVCIHLKEKFRKKKKKKDKESWKKFVIISNAEGKHQFTKCCTRSKLVDIMQHLINKSINCIEMKRKEIK